MGMAPDPSYRTRDITDRFSMLVDTEGVIGGDFVLGDVGQMNVE